MDTPTHIEAPGNGIAGVGIHGGLVVVFTLAGQRYGIPADDVQEIQQIVAMADVPAGRHGVVGMVNLRGDVVPAIDMRSIVGLPTRPYALDTPMMIVRVDGQPIALLVDAVEDVLPLPAEGLQRELPRNTFADAVVGVAQLEGGLVSVLDSRRLVEIESAEKVAP